MGITCPFGSISKPTNTANLWTCKGWFIVLEIENGRLSPVSQGLFAMEIMDGVSRTKLVKVFPNVVGNIIKEAKTLLVCKAIRRRNHRWLAALVVCLATVTIWILTNGGTSTGRNGKLLCTIPHVGA